MDLEKFADRIEGMLFHTCGCSDEEAKIVIAEVLRRINMTRDQKKEYMERRKKEHEEVMKQIEIDAEKFIKEHMK